MDEWLAGYSCCSGDGRRAFVVPTSSSTGPYG